jgi:polar amino acid transport system permease protein
VDLLVILTELGKGMITTVEIFILTLIIALPLGLIVSLGRISKNTLLRNIIRIYISIMRGTPLILQLMVVYFGPYYLLGISMPRGYRFWAIIIGFSLNYGAYFGEIYRSGIESMPNGQFEAAKLLGYSKSQAFMKIILPQVIKRILPSITNEVITLVKDTSLAFAISVPEMFTVAKALVSAQTTMIPFVAAGIFYFIFNFIVAMIMEIIEKKLNYYR